MFELNKNGTFLERKKMFVRERKITISQPTTTCRVTGKSMTGSTKTPVRSTSAGNIDVCSNKPTSRNLTMTRWDPNSTTCNRSILSEFSPALTLLRLRRINKNWQCTWRSSSGAVQ